MANIRIRLISEWKHAWAYWSIKLNSIGILLLSFCQIVNEAWSSMPSDIRQVVPYAQGISLALFIAGMAARLVAQPKAQAKINEKMGN